MTLADCMRLLGLPETATVEEIKRAYRRLAQRLHPDKKRGDLDAQSQFIEVSKAYRMLVSAARACRQGKPVGTCRDCGDFGEVSIGLDGHPRCGRCVFHPAGGRLLPLPVYVVVKCTVTIVLLAAGAYLLLLATATDSKAYGMAAACAGMLGLISLAITCLSIVRCIHPGDRVRQRNWSSIRRRLRIDGPS
ncbi:MAG TPA: J domain-containing protein [Phycisphaerae bacterium]|nr:J domain-containing protein [Phycisphaerae bacterium]HRR86748.1 J domain-containing protein [Phycisphaerae bacterium]